MYTIQDNERRGTEKAHIGYPDRRRSGGLAEGRTF